jgi:AraC-like DNA-binding protein
MDYSGTYALDRVWPPMLKDLGVSSANVLRRAGLPEDLLSLPNIRLAPYDFYRFWNSIEKELDDTDFPVRICRAIRTEFFSPPLFAALCSPDFLTAIRRIAQYKSLVAPMRLDIVADANCVSLDLVWLGDAVDVPLSFVILELLFFAHLARLGTRENIVPIQVMTKNPPHVSGGVAKYLGIEIQSGQCHRLVFSKTDALRPFLTASDDMWMSFEPQLRRRLFQLGASGSTEQRVRSVLIEAIPSGMISVASVSEKLAISKRSLQRQLADEGTTFINILQDMRQKLAIHYLQKTDIAISEIAFLLGFIEENSFYRAFKHWTGKTPIAFRQVS